MPYLAVDENGDAYIFENKPVRDYLEWMPNHKQFLSIPKGTIRKLIGRDLTWQDDPVELTEEMVKPQPESIVKLEGDKLTVGNESVHIGFYSLVNKAIKILLQERITK